MYGKLAFQINSCQSEKPDILMGEEHLAKSWKLDECLLYREKLKIFYFQEYAVLMQINDKAVPRFKIRRVRGEDIYTKASDNY